MVNDEETKFYYVLYITSSSILALILVYYYISTRSKTKLTPPEPPRWPVIGHLHLLSGPKLVHVKLAELADEYGPVMQLQIGVRPTLIITDPIAAKECFTINDRSFASRPSVSAGNMFGYGSAIVPWAPYGPYWRDTRRICSVELLCARRLDSLSYIRDEETCNLVKSIIIQSREKIESIVLMKENFLDLLLSIILRMIGGKRFLKFEDEEKAREFKKAVEEAFYYAGKPLVGDALPWLKWLDHVNGTQREMARVAVKIDSVFQSWLDEPLISEACLEEKDLAFMDVIIAMANENKISGLLDSTTERKKTVIKSLVKTMIFGTMDTTSITMEWAMAELLNKPHLLQKAQNEIDMKIGMERKVEESDIIQLPYLQAIIKETLRLHPPGPLLIPHESIEDCFVAGYKISAGTQLLVNAWKIHRDPKYWNNPLEFEPERFMKGEESINQFQFIPFGAGRRVCPGISFAMSMLHLTIGRLLHGFEWKVPPSISQVDMAEGPGLSTPKAIPLEAIAIPRNCSRLYL